MKKVITDGWHSVRSFAKRGSAGLGARTYFTRRRKVVLCIALVLLCACLVGCVPGDGANSPIRPAGFFTGIWHGWIAPISLVVSIFKRNVGIYEVFNTGFLYDLGYYGAIIGGFGSLSYARKRGKHRHRDDD